MKEMIIRNFDEFMRNKARDLEKRKKELSEEIKNNDNKTEKLKQELSNINLRLFYIYS